jgi:iron complex outermembrane receptor protein
MRAQFCSRMISATALAGSLALAPHAYAQEADENVGLQDIIVTAQKREQSIQDVPVAVTALDEDALQANRIVNAAGLTGLAPGLVARAGPGALGSISFAMRGVNANPSAPLQDKEISVYVDGVYIGGSRGNISELMEVERIEVLRGPQGTLFGRNSTAGAVNVITRNPTGEFEFTQAVTYGNQDQLRTRTTLDTPSFGPFSAIVSYVHDEKRGDVRNLGAGVVWDRTNPFTKVGVQTSPKWLGGRNYENVFASLRFDPGTDFTATYKFDWSKGKFVPEARIITLLNPNDFIGRLLLGVIAAQPAGGGKFGPVSVNSNDRRPDAFNNAWTTHGFQRVQGHNLTLEWRASDKLTLKNIFAYRKTGVFSGGTSIAGLSGTEFTAAAIQPYALFVAATTVPGFATLPPAQQGAVIGQVAQGLTPLVGRYFAAYEGASYGRHWQVSDELQLNYSTENLDLTAGLLYFKSKTSDSGLPGFAPNFAFQPVTQTIPKGNVLEAGGTTKSYAAYLQAEYAFTPQFGIVAGGRITKDEKVSRFSKGGTFNGSDIVGKTVVPNAEFKKSKFTYSLGVNYKPTDDLLLYAKYATGFLSGGAYADISFEPEIATSWEAGLKSEFLDRRVRFNLAAYSVKYKNLQASIPGSTIARFDLNIAVVRAGNLKVEGLEADLNIVPFDGLTLGGTVGYISKQRLSDNNPLLDNNGAGRVPIGQPDWVGTVNAQYVTSPFWGDATLMLRADMTFQSKMRISPNPLIDTQHPAFIPFKYMPSKQLVNGRIALRDVEIGGANVEFALWGKNILDNKKPLYEFLFPNFLATASYEQARTYGLDVIFKFGREEEAPPPPPPTPPPPPPPPPPAAPATMTCPDGTVVAVTDACPVPPPPPAPEPERG